MRIYPAPHYTMGGLWVDYHLMSTIPGLFVGGEANFSDQGANRLGASALMQGLSDGYFILPATVPDYLAGTRWKRSIPRIRRSGRRRRRSTGARTRCSTPTAGGRWIPSTGSWAG
jgi:Succinate dehydrogenase/fumarate reductase, flavoprotein subunit